MQSAERNLTQKDYDTMIRQIMNDGATAEDAAIEAIDIFTQEGMNTERVYMYKSSFELSEKEKLDSRFGTIEKALRGNESFINANFALQGMKQILCGEPTNDFVVGAWLLMLSRKMTSMCIHLIPSPKNEADSEEDKEENTKGNAEDDEDEDEDNVLATVSILEFLKCLFIQSNQIRNQVTFIDDLFIMNEETTMLLCKRFDEYSDEVR
jgi:hypothetical protein